MFFWSAGLLLVSCLAVVDVDVDLVGTVSYEEWKSVMVVVDEDDVGLG